MLLHMRQEEAVYRDPYQAALLGSLSQQAGFLDDVAKAAGTAAGAMGNLPKEIKDELTGLVTRLVDVITASLDKPAQCAAAAATGLEPSAAEQPPPRASNLPAEHLQPRLPATGSDHILATCD